MKRAKSVEALGGRRRWQCRPYCFLLSLCALYIIFITFKFTHFLKIGTTFSGLDDADAGSGAGDLAHPQLDVSASHRKLEHSRPRTTPDKSPLGALAPFRQRYGRITGEILRRKLNNTVNISPLERVAEEAWSLGLKAWAEINSPETSNINYSSILQRGSSGHGEKLLSCPSSVSMSRQDAAVPDREWLMLLPCGLAAGSSITVVGAPQKAHAEYMAHPAGMRGGGGTAMVSQFVVELQGLRAVDAEDPPRILHLNPRLKGDWSHSAVIEHNTCYRMQWGKAMRCEGLPTKDDDDTVDGFIKCERWARSDSVDMKESKSTSWLQRFIGRAKKPDMLWPFPFVEGRLFVLTLQAGVEGYHIYVGGRHVTSFPYRTGFPLEDATGLAIKGNVDTHSVYATSLPTSHPSFSLQHDLDMSEKWKSNPLPEGPVNLFIGVLSATNHFAERMAIRKTWMQSPEIKASKVVARFFVALSPRKEVNAMLKKEAAFFGDIVILQFMDHYELVVLKTLAICEFGIQNLTAPYIMKCDDDTFVSLDAVLREVMGISHKKPLYMGNLNFLHRPLRTGKWAVIYEEWPEDLYPPYANGPGYIISSDIARYIVLQHANQSLRLFKMEDVSMGMWVEQFNATSAVQYSHSWKFCQYGCLENYYTAHYQSPMQMICLWDKLSRGQAKCCNFR